MPPIRAADPSTVVGFELQLLSGWLRPANLSTKTMADFIERAMGLNAHTYEQHRQKSNVLLSAPTFDLAYEARSHGIDLGSCPLSRELQLPDAFLCGRLELVSHPSPLRAAIGTADDVAAWAAGATVGKQLIKHGKSRSQFQYDLELHHGLVLTNVPYEQLSRVKVLPQATTAVPLAKLRQWMHAASDRVQVNFVRTPDPRHFSQFLRRVDTVCREDAMPETYCGFLAYCGHKARSIATATNSTYWATERKGHTVKERFNRGPSIPNATLPEILPIIPRSNVASAWEYVRAYMEHNHPSLTPDLATRVERHMHTILLGDLPLGIASPLFDVPQHTYSIATREFFMRVIREISPTMHTKGLRTACEWLFERPLDGSTSRDRRASFTRHFLDLSHLAWVSYNNSDGTPLLVSDWIHEFTQGRDFLSDSGSYNLDGPIFKSVGAWGVGPKGQVYLENSQGMDFDWKAETKYGWTFSKPIRGALDGYKQYVRELQGTLRGSSALKGVLDN